MANVGNPPLCSGVIAVQNGPKSHTFTLILAMFASQPRWRNKPWKSLLAAVYKNFEQKWPKFRGDLNSRTWKATRVLPPPRMVVCPCPPISEQTASGENPWERGKKLLQKFISDRKINRNKRTFRSFPLQISGLVSVKVRVVWYKWMSLMIVFLYILTRSSALCLWNKCIFSLMEFADRRKFGISLWPKVSIIPL